MEQSISSKQKRLSVVVIGLNEAATLRQALESALVSKPIGWLLEVIYVDSGSSDSSVAIAESISGVRVLHLQSDSPSAAKGRNLGLSVSTGNYIQFLDGDSILQPNWLDGGVRALESDNQLACVFGHCQEMYPDQSLYMRVCGLDWHVPPGEYRLSGGNALWRRDVFDAIGHFDENLRLGEEPDLCYRVRQHGWKIRCIDVPMVSHDLGMKTFVQYWRRGESTGRAYVSVSTRYWREREKLWLYETIRNFAEPIIWATIWCFGYVVGGIVTGTMFLLSWMLLRGARTAYSVRRRTRDWREAVMYAMHSQVIRLPIAVGQVKALLFR